MVGVQVGQEAGPVSDLWARDAPKAGTGRRVTGADRESGAWETAGARSGARLGSTRVVFQDWDGTRFLGGEEKEGPGPSPEACL